MTVKWTRKPQNKLHYILGNGQLVPQAWTRLHIDNAGPFLGKLFLLVVDSHSKWLEVIPVPSTSSSYTNEALRHMFATHGLSQIIVSDNGTAFTSQEFKTFVKNNRIQHVTTAPYHPASNGMAERAAQTFKLRLKKATKTNVLVELDRFLFQYMQDHSSYSNWSCTCPVADGTYTMLQTRSTTTYVVCKHEWLLNNMS